MSDTRFSVIAQFLVVIVVVLGATALAAFEVIDSTTISTIYGAALGFSGQAVRSSTVTTTNGNGPRVHTREEHAT